MFFNRKKGRKKKEEKEREREKETAAAGETAQSVKCLLKNKDVTSDPRMYIKSWA